MRTGHTTKIALTLLFLIVVSAAQHATPGKTPAAESSPLSAAAEDISGMYSFLKEGEFVQINLEPSGVSGYVSREGDMESDRGQFLDQFFTKAFVRGHDVSFVTKPVHGVWFEFKGRFDRGPGKTKTEDAYYLLHGTLTEFRSDPANQTTSHSREAEFTWLAQPIEK
jgi:hypothetical protein